MAAFLNLAALLGAVVNVALLWQIFRLLRTPVTPLVLGPDDLLILETEAPVSQEAALRAQRHWKRICGHERVIVLSGATAKVLRDGAA